MAADSNDGGGPPAAPEDILERSVYTADGRFLGKATKLEKGWFRLDVPQELDYWLPYDAVRAIVHDQVLLEIDSAGARQQRRLEHPASASRRLDHEEQRRLYEWADEPAADEEEGEGGELSADAADEDRRPFGFADAPADGEALEQSGDHPPRTT